MTIEATRRRVIDGWTFTRNAEIELIEIYNEDAGRVERTLKDPDYIDDKDPTGRDLWKYVKAGYFVIVNEEKRMIISVGGGDRVDDETRAFRMEKYIEKVTKAGEVKGPDPFAHVGPWQKEPAVRPVPASPVTVTKIDPPAPPKPTPVPKPTPLAPPPPGVLSIPPKAGLDDPARYFEFWERWLQNKLAKNPYLKKG